MKFLDEAKIYACAGNGGAGSVSFRREKFIAKGGPNGGDGGRGGDVLAVCVNGLNTLIDYRYQQHFNAQKGGKGKGRNRAGADGENKVLHVPAGTQVFSEDGEVLLGELTQVGQSLPLLYGGRGGRGNCAFKTATNQTPTYAQSGEKGQESTLLLRLSLIAHAGLMGFPNAGKSTLLSVLSAARPKIADYPFTTLHPNLGVVRAENSSFVMADIPGLIEGAHEGAGLGHRFLRHIERCSVLLHLIDCNTQAVEDAWLSIRKELQAYSDRLAQKPELIVLTKSDLISQEDINKKAATLKKVSGKEVIAISSVAHLGLNELNHIVLAHINQNHTPKEEAEEIRKWQP